MMTLSSFPSSWGLTVAEECELDVCASFLRARRLMRRWRRFVQMKVRLRWFLCLRSLFRTVDELLLRQISAYWA